LGNSGVSQINSLGQFPWDYDSKYIVNNSSYSNSYNLYLSGMQTLVALYSGKKLKCRDWSIGMFIQYEDGYINASQALVDRIDSRNWQGKQSTEAIDLLNLLMSGEWEII
jgi:hypothetical protein